MKKNIYINALSFFLLSARLAKKVYISSSSYFFLLSTLSRDTHVRVYACVCEGGWERGKKRKKVSPWRMGRLTKNPRRHGLRGRGEMNIAEQNSFREVL